MTTPKNTQSSGSTAGYTYPSYEFTPILGWSISRYELFRKCRRWYFYHYYRKHVPGVSLQKINRLRSLTTIALEAGNIVHDIVEKFLKRLQKSDAQIDRPRFFEYARGLTVEYSSKKEFLETYYGKKQLVDSSDIYPRVNACISNFLDSPCFNWIFMKALTNRENWLIEPGGYGETRIQGMKAYCKMDFLFPVDDGVYILDWKTGSRDEYKHGMQLKAYALAARHNFDIPVARLFPKIIYLYPEVSEFSTSFSEDDLSEFVETVKSQTEEMYAFCADVQQNIPLPMDTFHCTENKKICGFCNYREICECGG